MRVNVQVLISNFCRIFTSAISADGNETADLKPAETYTIMFVLPLQYVANSSHYAMLFSLTMV
jgi:hypothetical protein